MKLWDNLATRAEAEGIYKVFRQTTVNSQKTSYGKFGMVLKLDHRLCLIKTHSSVLISLHWDFFISPSVKLLLLQVTAGDGNLGRIYWHS